MLFSLAATKLQNASEEIIRFTGNHTVPCHPIERRVSTEQRARERGTRRGIFRGGELTEVSDPVRKIPQRSAVFSQPLRPYLIKTTKPKLSEREFRLGQITPSYYSMILATTPAPTVRPPSRIAKRRPSSMAIGAIRSTTILMLSPGITISTPSGSSQLPVTSVVRK
jgi:hypothetical protein